MITIERIRHARNGILAIGTHTPLLQSILDFDFLSAKKEPSLVAIVGGARTAQKLFFGTQEILIPCFADIALVPQELCTDAAWMLNTASGRRALEATERFFGACPRAVGGHIFAEQVPEVHATKIIARYGKRYLIAGPSGVGFCVAGHLKLGAIGGTDIQQLEHAKLATEGSVAVVSTSGGMTNELIRAVISAGKRLSFAFCIGGERFPAASLTDVLRLAQEDPATHIIVYFGELGGVDEYEIAVALENKTLTKPIIC